MDDERLTGSGNNYFDELLERVRKIRASEAHFYQKVRGIFATSIDYDPKDETATVFFQTVQNKFHFAITGHTAAEIIANRVSAQKRDMGLTHKKGKRVAKQEITVAKNYLEELELKRLELLVEQFLSFAELQSVEQRPMYMSDWTRKLDEFIRLNDKQVLIGKGSVTSEFAKHVAFDEYEIYARNLLTETTIGGDDYTKDDFERAIDKSAKQTTPKSRNGNKRNEFVTSGVNYLDDYTLLLRLLSSSQSIWQLSAVVLPPLLQGVIWSACMLPISKCFPHFGQMPFCLSYAARAILGENARIFKCFSSPLSKYSYMPEIFVTSSSSIRSTIRASRCFGSYLTALYWL